MSGKPVIQPWAVESTFTAPGKAWDAQPTKVAPIGDLFIPAQKEPAENMNALRAMDQATAQAISDFSPNPAQNFGLPFSMPTSVTAGVPSAACWDPLDGAWLVAVTGSSDAEVRVGQGQDPTNWSQLETATLGSAGTITSICKDPASAGAFLGITQSGSAVIFHLVSGVYNSLGNNTSANEGSTVATFLGILVAAYSGTTGAGSTICKTTGLTVAFTPTGGVTWAMKSGPAELLAIPAQTAGASPYLVRTVDGATFTKIPITAGVLATTDQPADLVNIGGSVWLLIVNTNGAGMKVAKSVDGGLSWGVIATLTTPILVQTTPLAAAFGQLVCALVKDSSTIQTVIYSLDGGVTWRRSTSTNYGSGNLFLVQGETGLAISNAAAIRFSQNAGYTAALT